MATSSMAHQNEPAISKRSGGRQANTATRRIYHKINNAKARASQLQLGRVGAMVGRAFADLSSSRKRGADQAMAIDGRHRLLAMSATTISSGGVAAASQMAAWPRAAICRNGELAEMRGGNAAGHDDERRPASMLPSAASACQPVLPVSARRPQPRNANRDVFGKATSAAQHSDGGCTSRHQG